MYYRRRLIVLSFTAFDFPSVSKSFVCIHSVIWHASWRTMDYEFVVLGFIE